MEMAVSRCWVCTACVPLLWLSRNANTKLGEPGFWVGLSFYLRGSRCTSSRRCFDGLCARSTHFGRHI